MANLQKGKTYTKAQFGIDAVKGFQGVDYIVGGELFSLVTQCMTDTMCVYLMK
jgi:hypothetical protein